MVRINTLAQLSKLELLENIELQLRSKARMGVARRLAPQLMAKLYINPEGVDLTCWIADVKSRTNHDAVVRWIHAQLIELEEGDTLLSYALIEELAARLMRSLARLEAANS